MMHYRDVDDDDDIHDDVNDDDDSKVMIGGSGCDLYCFSGVAG